jgi:hypothetical protein
MGASTTLPDRLSKAIASYVEWRGRSRPVSLQRIVKASRYLMPEVEMPQRQLADLIATDLVAMGCDIEFDLSEEDGASDASRPPKREKTRPLVDHGTPSAARGAVGS